MKKNLFATTQKQHTALELIEAFLEDKKITGKAEKTIQSYSGALKTVGLVIDFSQSVESLTKKDIEKFIGSCKERNLSEHSIEHYIKHFKAFMNWCANEGYSVVSVPSYSAPETVKPTYSDSDLMKLLKKPDMRTCQFSEYRDWVIVNFFIETGCRASSLTAIRIEDVDFDNSLCQFRHNKTGKVQAVPLSLTLVKRLKAYLKIRGTVGENVLFPQIDGTAMTYNALRLAIARYNKRRGVSLTSIHAFRHTFAKNYLLSEGDPFRLQKILNHSTLEMTKRYCRIYNTDIVNNFESHSTLSRLSPDKERIRMR